MATEFVVVFKAFDTFAAYKLDTADGALAEITTPPWTDFPPAGEYAFFRFSSGRTSAGIIGGEHSTGYYLIDPSSGETWLVDLQAVAGAAMPPGAQGFRAELSENFIHVAANDADVTADLFVRIPVSSVLQGQPQTEGVALEVPYSGEPFAATDLGVVYSRWAGSATVLFFAAYDGGETELYITPSFGYVGGDIAAAMFDNELYVLTGGTYGATNAKLVYLTPAGAVVGEIPYTRAPTIISPSEVWVDHGSALQAFNASLEPVGARVEFEQHSSTYTIAPLFAAPAPECFWTDLNNVTQYCMPLGTS